MNYIAIVIFTLSSLLTSSLFAGKDFPDGTVPTESGLVSGVHSSVGIWSFKGIPYARPPVGNLRWREPQPALAWAGVRKATEFGAGCLQPESKSVPVQSEDCLFLNVWSPAPLGKDKLPVMVWIHGGGFVTGASSYQLSDGRLLYDGEALARHGVVLVSFNYRLGPFGFFGHPGLSRESESGVSGNYGLRDQIAALQWVQRNIREFGGDPAQVTIFGESAGGQSVADLMVAPTAEGTFQRVISDSGFGEYGAERALRSDLGKVPSLEKVGESVAAYLGCSGPDVVECLRAKPVADLLKLDDDDVMKSINLSFHSPVIDGVVIPENPLSAFPAGHQQRVPLLLGLNRDEGAWNGMDFKPRTVEGYQTYVRENFPNRYQAVLTHFPAASDEAVPWAVDALFTVLNMTIPVRQMARDMRTVGSPVYQYEFTRVPPYAAEQKLFGAYHALELFYLFGVAENHEGFEAVDASLSVTMQRYWTNFVKTGRPEGEPPLVEWPAFSRGTDEPYLELGDHVRSGTRLSESTCDFFVGNAFTSRSETSDNRR